MTNTGTYTMKTTLGVQVFRPNIKYVLSSSKGDILEYRMYQHIN